MTKMKTDGWEPLESEKLDGRSWQKLWNSGVPRETSIRMSLINVKSEIVCRSVGEQAH
jgi:hypothetical protein